MADLTQMLSKCSLWVEVDELAEASMERLGWLRMPTERVEPVEAACTCLHDHQT